MQNVIYAVIGVILTVAAMYMVSPSISKSSEAIQAGMISTEAAAIKNASKMWLANVSSDGTYGAIDGADIEALVPELKESATDDTLTSKTATVTHLIAPSTTTVTNDSITITTTCASDAQAVIVKKNYEGLGDVSTPGTNKVAIVKIKG